MRTGHRAALPLPEPDPAPDVEAAGEDPDQLEPNTDESEAPA